MVPLTLKKSPGPASSPQILWPCRSNPLASRPGASDLTVKQVQEAQEYKDTLKCGFVVSRKIGNMVIGRQIREMAADGGMPILTAEVENRVPFAESLTMGQSIFEWAPKSAAAQEIQFLTQEILSYGTEELHNCPQAV